jgi:hypothetical protein
MPPKEREDIPAEQKKQDRKQRKILIGRHVMSALGEPSDLQVVHVRELWDDRYRVNIVVGKDAASARIAHSCFLVTDGNGNIIDSVPKITKDD